MADQPYQFGDVVDGHRWTITGWEPVEPVERTVGVPRLLEARYAATQEAQARQQTQTLEPEAPSVVEDSPDEPVEAAQPPEAAVAEAVVADDALQEMAHEPEPEQSYSLEELLGGGRRVVAGPDLAIEFDAEPAEAEQADQPARVVDEPLEDLVVEEPVDEIVAVVDVLVVEEHDEAVAEAQVEQWHAAEATTIEGDLDPEPAVLAEMPDPVEGSDLVEPEGSTPEPEPYDARPVGMRAWYGLGIEPIEEPEPEPSPFEPGPVDDDAAFAAALALGTRALAERHQPSEIEIAAGVASSAAVAPNQPWTAPAWEPIDEWTSTDSSVVAAEPLDSHALTYGSASLPEPAQAEAAPDLEPRVVTQTPPPPAGWYPGSA